MQNYYNHLQIIFDPIAFRYHQEFFINLIKSIKKNLPISRFTFILKFILSNWNTAINKIRRKFFSNLLDRAKFKIESSLNTKRERKKKRRKKGKKIAKRQFHRERKWQIVDTSRYWGKNLQEDYRDFDTVEDCFLSSHLSIRRVSIEFASEGTVFEATAAGRSLPPRIKTRPSCQRRERPSTKLTGHGTHILSPRITFITILISLGWPHDTHRGITSLFLYVVLFHNMEQ